jgi:hypothetical protein
MIFRQPANLEKNDCNNVFCGAIISLFHLFQVAVTAKTSSAHQPSF